MDVDTDAVFSIGAELEMIALGWTGTAMAGRSVPSLQGACGPTPLETEIANGIRTFTRRAQEAIRELAHRASAASAALTNAAAVFEKIETELGNQLCPK